MDRWVGRVLSVLIAMTVASATAAPQAGAHATLIASSPGSGAVLGTMPTRVSATFDEELEPSFAALTVVDGDGRTWSADAVKTSGPELSVGLRADAPPGGYTASYRLIAADGHVVTGSWRFDVRSAGTGSTP